MTKLYFLLQQTKYFITKQYIFVYLEEAVVVFLIQKLGLIKEVLMLQ